MLGANLTQRQKEIATGFVALGLSVGLLGLAEAGLRANQILTFGTVGMIDEGVAFRTQAESGLKLPVPGARLGKIQLNELGLRGPDVPVPKPAGTVRLAFLGSSTTFDPHDWQDDNTWPGRAATRLNEAFAGSCRVDYVNAGVPGFGVGSMLVLFRAVVAKTQPDIVILEAEGMNARLNTLAKEAGLYDRMRYTPSLLAQHSLFWAKMEKNFEVLRLERGGHTQTGKLSLEGKDLLGDFPSTLEKAINEIQAAGALPVLLSPGSELRRNQSAAEQVGASHTALLYMTYMSIEGLLAAQERFEAATASVAKAAGLPFIQWQPDVPGTPDNWVDTRHFSPKGASLMGPAVAQHLLDDPQTRALFEQYGCRVGTTSSLSGS